MKIVQLCSFIHRFVHFTCEYHALKTHLTHGYTREYGSCNAKMEHDCRIFITDNKVKDIMKQKYA
jgi:hypothetical protein